MEFMCNSHSLLGKEGKRGLGRREKRGRGVEGKLRSAGEFHLYSHTPVPENASQQVELV